MIALEALPPAVPGSVAFVLGLIVGSFLNVVIHRLPREESLVRPGSRCPACRTPIAPWDNLPLLSYLILGGRCRHCGTRISARYPAIELLTALVFAAIAWRHGLDPMTPVWFAFAAALIAAAMIDFDHRIIPDEISLGGVALALVLVPGVHVAGGAAPGTALLHSAAGALLGGGSLWLVGFLHARVSVALGRRFEHWPDEGEPPPRFGSLDYWIWFPGVGFGDVKLLAMIGAVMGPWGVLQTILAASLAGLAFGIAWAVLTRRWTAPFGFGPAIAAGALLVLLLPERFLMPGLALP
jgi:leader peptidase (prepilin peptidase)/N-methyltransferase